MVIYSDGDGGDGDDGDGDDGDDDGTSSDGNNSAGEGPNNLEVCHYPLKYPDFDIARINRKNITNLWEANQTDNEDDNQFEVTQRACTKLAKISHTMAKISLCLLASACVNRLLASMSGWYIGLCHARA